MADLHLTSILLRNVHHLATRRTANKPVLFLLQKINELNVTERHNDSQTNSTPYMLFVNVV